jgi:predicted aconitase with swiveling domain
MILTARVLVHGSVVGAVAALPPLSFWGGYDPEQGLVTDRSHPAFGQSLQGRVLVMSAGRGSSSSSSVLAEAIRLGTGPAAIVLSEPDAILTIGALVADALYGRSIPVVIVAPADHVLIAAAAKAEIDATDEGGRVRIG